MPNNKELDDETMSEENLKGIGQEILGDLEIIGGMLTGDPGATAEGKFNAGVGEIRHESAEALEDEEE
ncbi:MAG: hypothetical protein KIS76_06695 [Pyrinomonadaceae bacterium]|nr:hypothetical protein [Pyrinomonadaceae bacterium]